MPKSSTTSFGHCVKSVCVFTHLELIRKDMRKYGVSLRIQSECRKMQIRTTLNTDTFHKVGVLSIFLSERWIWISSIKYFYVASFDIIFINVFFKHYPFSFSLLFFYFPKRAYLSYSLFFNNATITLSVHVFCCIRNSFLRH